MKDALELVWQVFLEFEAPDYTDEGIKEFKKTTIILSFCRPYEGALRLALRSFTTVPGDMTL